MGILELIGVALAAIVSAFLYGRSKGKAKEKEKQNAEYIETRKRMDAIDVDGDDGALRDWLRERGKSGGNL